MEGVSGVWMLLPLRERGQALWCFTLGDFPNGHPAWLWEKGTGE